LEIGGGKKENKKVQRLAGDRRKNGCSMGSLSLGHSQVVFLGQETTQRSGLGDNFKHIGEEEDPKGKRTLRQESQNRQEEPFKRRLCAGILGWVGGGSVKKREGGGESPISGTTQTS